MDDFIFVGETLSSHKSYVYNANSLPRWVEVSEPELLKMVKLATEFIFYGTPQNFLGNLSFYKRILDIFKVDRFYSLARFKET